MSGCSSLLLGQTHYKAPTLVCDREQWKDATVPLGYLLLLSNALFVPSVPPK